MGKCGSCNNFKNTCCFLMKFATWIVRWKICASDFSFTFRPCVRLSDCCPSIRPSAKSGSCDNLKTVSSLLMKLGKWTDVKVEVMHVLLFCSSTINFCCYVNLKFNCGSCDNLKTARYFLMKLNIWIDGKMEIMHILSF